MPLYEYECSACGKSHEVMQKFYDAPLAECPDCGKPVQKKISLSGFALKGSGWYASDYKRPPAAAAKPAEKPAAETSTPSASDGPKKTSTGPKTPSSN